jgi:hypothetical protein
MNWVFSDNLNVGTGRDLSEYAGNRFYHDMPNHAGNPFHCKPSVSNDRSSIEFVWLLILGPNHDSFVLQPSVWDRRTDLDKPTQDRSRPVPTVLFLSIQITGLQPTIWYRRTDMDKPTQDRSRPVPTDIVKYG